MKNRDVRPRGWFKSARLDHWLRLVVAPSTLLLAGAGCDELPSARGDVEMSATALVAAEPAPVAPAVIDEPAGDEWSAAAFNDGDGARSAVSPGARTTEPPERHSPTKAAEPKQPVAGPDATARALAEVKKKPANEPVSVTVILDEVDFDWATFRSVRSDDARRASLVARRRADLTGVQTGLRNWLSSVGVTDVETYFIVNHVRATVPAGLVEALAQRPGVRGIRLSARSEPTRAFSGFESTNGTLITNFHNASLDGNSGNRTASTSPIRVGIIEAAGNLPNRNHVGFREGSSSTPVRMVAVRDCAQANCPTTTTNGGSNHGTQVSWVVGGDLVDGQDAAVTNVDSRRRRSGHLREAELHYFATTFSDHHKRALDRVVTDGLDVVNQSLAYRIFRCVNDTDLSGLNAAHKAAFNGGVVVVTAAGNDGQTGCQVGYPAFRTHTLSIGSLSTTSETAAYGSILMSWFSGRGGLPITTWAGVPNTTAAIDVVAPGHFTYYFTGGTNTYETAVEINGTSFASPVVAAAAGLMREEMKNLGWNPNSAGNIMANIILQGDGWDANTGTEPATTLSDLSGNGRLRMHRPRDADLTAPWGWVNRSAVINQSDSVRWHVKDTAAESSLLTGYKWAAFWNEDDLTAVADIDFRVLNVCPAGGGEEVVAQDLGYGLRARFNLTASEVRGKCLVIEAYGHSVPTGGRTVYMAEYFHSGTNTGIH